VEFKIERDLLVSMLEGPLRMVSPRATHPVLGGLRVTYDGTRLEIAGTNLEQYLSIADDVGSIGGEEGAVVVPGKLFGEVAKSLPDGAVTIRSAGGEITVRGAAKRSEFSLNSLSLEDWPEFQVTETTLSVTVEPAIFATALGQVVVAASADEVRPVLTGVLWAFSEGTVRIVATDSYRLALRDVAVKGSVVPDEDVSAIVPASALVELRRHLNGSGELTLGFGANQAVAAVGRARLVTRLIEGEYPKYRQLVPEGYPNRLTADTKALSEATKRVSIVAGTNTPLKVHLGEEVRLTAVEAGIGDATETLEAASASYEGEPMVVAFNPRFLGDGLAVVGTPRVCLEVASPTKPGLLRGITEGGDPVEEFAMVVMPVRTSR
jgi:DNA polymerase-3 subunit beta